MLKQIFAGRLRSSMRSTDLSVSALHRSALLGSAPRTVVNKVSLHSRHADAWNFKRTPTKTAV
jgi:hypothetical protein